LRSWRNEGHLSAHKTSAEEVSDLLAVADRDLEDCASAGLSADNRLGIAYSAALACAKAALAAAGYRAKTASGHYYTIQSLAHTMRCEPKLISQLDGFRRKRNRSDYERIGTVTEQEAEEMVQLARFLRSAVEDWLRSHYPHLLVQERGETRMLE